MPQKAGYPQHAINEIHGSWFDPSNPTVLMDDAPDIDLYNNMIVWANKTDLCLVIGTSLSGMEADRMGTTCAYKSQKNIGIGMVIINLQRTPYDNITALRI